MIAIRRARPSDAAAIGAVHVAAWRSTYPGILPDDYLALLSEHRQAMHYDRTIRAGLRPDPRAVTVHVATVSGTDLGPGGGASRIVGFATGAPSRILPPEPARDAVGPAGDGAAQSHSGLQALGEGEIETLYVLDDWRERGLGRRLIRAAALQLREQGCRSAYLWVLRDNPSRWFYARLGGRPIAEGMVRVGSASVPQTAYLWDPIDRLALATSASS